VPALPLPDRLTSALAGIIAAQISKGLDQDEKTRKQFVVHGLPHGVLQELYSSMTNGSTTNWEVTSAHGPRDVTVLLIVDDPNSTGLGVPPIEGSRVCTWDYAVDARNSWPLVVLLVSPLAHSARPESIATATVSLGPSGGGPLDGLWNSRLWLGVVDDISTTLAPAGIAPDATDFALHRRLAESGHLSPMARHAAPWETAARLLGSSIGPDEFCGILGFPRTVGGISSSLTVKKSRATLQSLAAYLEKEGTADGITALKATPPAAAPNVALALDDLRNHLLLQSSAGMDFAADPHSTYAADIPLPSWWTTLDVATLDTLLQASGSAPTQQRLRPRVTNSLNTADKLDGEPDIVQHAVDIAAQDRSGSPVASAFTRGPTRPPVPIQSLPADPSRSTDPAPPAHDRRLRYAVQAQGYNPGNVDVISLDTFAPGGVSRLKHAASNPPPQLDAARWVQAIEIDSPGNHEMEVRTSSRTVRAEVTYEMQTVHPFASAAGVWTYLLQDLDRNDVIDVKLYDSTGGLTGGWEVRVSVEEAQEAAPRSYFEALVRAHQTRRRPRQSAPHPSQLRRIEAFLLDSPDSWKPVLAGWSGPIEITGPIDWSRPRLGDLEPVNPPRANSSPPAALLTAREEVRNFLLSRKVTIPEAELDNPVLRPAVERYIQEYSNWLQSDPGAAVWLDCIAVYAAVPNLEAGRPSPSWEPVAILLNPLHPLRIGWHQIAQRTLSEGLTSYCPAVGVLDPHRTPDIAAWPFLRTNEQAWKAFFSIGSGEPGWGLLVNREYLGRSPDAQGVLHALQALGFNPKAMGGGFSEAQTRSTLTEISALLPARATLRVGLVGKDNGRSTAVDGILSWCEDRFATSRSGLLGARAVEIHDGRPSPTGPLAGELDRLYEQTGESVRWFHHKPERMIADCDLTILDHLGIDDPKAGAAPSRSPLSPGAILRVRIRQDFHRASYLLESRIAVPVGDSTGVEDVFRALVTSFEDLASRDAGTSHLEFQPNQEAIRQRLDHTRFLAVSSSKLDPSCFTRGTELHGGYLWDFEVPDALGGLDEDAGFYLVARANDSMVEAVVAATQLVGAPPVPGAPFLQEVSKRGIPVLKKMAAGGTRSKGELGVLLGVRFLQDAFRTPAGPIRLPVRAGECLNLVASVDSYDDTFLKLATALGRGSKVRPDLLHFSIHISPAEVVSIRIVPLEVKFRDAPMGAPAKGAALSQASSFAGVLHDLFETPQATELWSQCAAALLASILDQAFRVYSDPTVHRGAEPDWTRVHQQVVGSVLGRTASVEVDEKGRLLAFDNSPHTHTEDVDGDGTLDTICVSFQDCALLLNPTPSHSPLLDLGFADLNLIPNRCLRQAAPPVAPAALSSSSSRGAQPIAQPVPAGSVEPPVRAPAPAPVPPSPPTAVPALAVTHPSTPAPTDGTFDGPATQRAPASPSPAEGQPRSAHPGPRGVAPAPPPVPRPAAQPAQPLPESAPTPPRLLTGWTGPGGRWAVVGQIPDTSEPVALDLDHPKVIGVFGYMGSGKSYLLGNIVESAVVPIEGVNSLAAPLAVVIFNYRRAASDRFELASFARPNQNFADIERLAREYHAIPRALTDVQVLCLPGQLADRLHGDYAGLHGQELFFRPDGLSVEDWELLMGQPGSDAVFAQTIRHALRDLRPAGPISLDALQRNVLGRLASGQSRQAAQLRFEFVRSYVNQARGVDFGQVIAPGRVTIIDLRDPLFTKEDALRFFLVCANGMARIQGAFNKMVVFDEAHEYLSSAFAELLDARLRLMRHEGTTYVFATQDVNSIPVEIRRFVTTRFVFNLGTADNVADLTQHYTEFEGYQLTSMEPGQCLLQDNQSSSGVFHAPRPIRVRPRVTAHGGESRIFADPTPR
jgi:DNA phosphorothioation-dependent restriction protein DptH